MQAQPDKAYDVFVSYHWRDHAPVEALAHTLRDLGLRVFLDRWYLHPGHAWPQELEGVAPRAGCRSNFRLQKVRNIIARP